MQDRSYTVSETASGTTNLANYVSTYQCVNVNNNNAVVASGSGTTATFTYLVPASADGANVKCTFTNTAKPQSFTVAKTSDKADAKPGDKVNYTLTLKNTGAVDYTTGNPARISDNLSKVIDDATYNNDAVATAGPAPSYSAPTLSWAGPLAVDASMTIKYSATVKADGQRGDNLLTNVVTGGSNCVPGSTDATCTTTTAVPQVERIRSRLIRLLARRLKLVRN
ncbi:conserved hypothetical protein [Renibacterium salmoninarum ATCC 33209]|uniref:Uncharacterized protein n=1 Tax=Renibacterium salmoninarum (strain ATCC 33209 / DSM 20767 / JCM 11484 / NBRC 15589 / NCIMB 2235) TaxID=288705 RepID=A9WQD4_RENSM|nr:conserved hypothetical protein [Renibacterium salmoninarum ATCC 33209]